MLFSRGSAHQPSRAMMKITGYRLLRSYHNWGRPIGDVNGFIDSGITEVPIVIVETDEGISGVATGSHEGVDRVFPALLGQDPRAVSTLYDRMLARVFKAGHAGSTFGGIGTLDSALWDLKAKIAGEPLWRLLGASDRFVAGYASGLDIALDDDELATFYTTMAQRGFSSGKLKGGRDAAADIRRLTILSDALSVNAARPALMLDANESWNLKQAVRHVSLVEEVHDLTWIEEPLRRWDAVGQARLSAAVRAGVATGENLTGLEQYRPLFDAGAIGVVPAGGVWRRARVQGGGGGGRPHSMRAPPAAPAGDLPMSPVGLSANSAVGHAAAAIP